LTCVDRLDPSRTAALDINSAFHISWSIGGASGDATLAGVELLRSGDRVTYQFHATSGELFDVDVAVQSIGLGTAFVACDPASARIERSLLDDLVTATNATKAKQQSFASCVAGGGTGALPTALTVRPALAGAGALIEGVSSGARFVLLARELPESGTGTVTYKGEGGTSALSAPGTKDLTFSDLVAHPSALPEASLSWDATDRGGVRVPFANGHCTIDGLAYASSLIPTH
jgi:hypothetical protein